MSRGVEIGAPVVLYLTGRLNDRLEDNDELASQI